MAKKTTKRGAKKVVIAPMAKPRRFKMSGEISQGEKVRAIGALTTLTVTEGWMLLRQTLEANMKVLDEQVLKKVGLDGKELTEAQCDRLRDRRNVMDELIHKPEQLLKELSREDVEETSDDPYFSIGDVGRRRGREDVEA